MKLTRAAITYLEVHRVGLALGAGAFVLSLVGSLAVVAAVLMRMPADYLNTPEDAPFWPGRPAWQRTAGRIGKNLLGLLVVAIGVVLAMPGVPGQGTLTIIIGVMLLDLRGKRRLERKLLGSPRILAGVNKIRARLGRPPVEAHRGPAEPPA